MSDARPSFYDAVASGLRAWPIRSAARTAAESIPDTTRARAGPGLARLVGDVRQAPRDSEPAPGDGGIDEHPVAEDVQEVGHAARRRPHGRRGASLRDGLPHSTPAATRATTRKWAGTGYAAEPQTWVPPMTMAASRGHQVLGAGANFSRSLHQWFPAALHPPADPFACLGQRVPGSHRSSRAPM